MVFCKWVGGDDEPTAGAGQSPAHQFVLSITMFARLRVRQFGRGGGFGKPVGVRWLSIAVTEDAGTGCFGAGEFAACSTGRNAFLTL